MSETNETVGNIEEFKILLVDDEPRFLNLAKKSLEKIDKRLKVETSTSAEEALDILESRNIDAVISDYEMPYIDGIEFLRKLKNRGGEIPFTILTGKGSEDIAIEAANLGVDQYLKKEGKARELFGKLAKALIKMIKRYKNKSDESHLIAWIEKKSYADLELVKYDLQKLANQTGFKIKNIELHKSPFEPETYEIVKAYTKTFEKVPTEKAEKAKEWVKKIVWADDIRDASVAIEGRDEKEKTKVLKKIQTTGVDITEKN